MTVHSMSNHLFATSEVLDSIQVLIHNQLSLTQGHINLPTASWGLFVDKYLNHHHHKLYFGHLLGP